MTTFETAESGLKPLPQFMGDIVMTTLAKFNPKELEAKVKAMYRSVAEEPDGELHFEMGRKLADRLMSLT